MTAIMSQAWKIVKPHIPSIRFRKGGTENVVKPIGKPASGPAAGSKSLDLTQQRPIIEDYQLPPRYRRQTIDDKEIDAINSGGAL